MPHDSYTSNSDTKNAHENPSLVRFLIKAGIMALLPLAIVAGTYACIDPFRVLRWHNDPFAHHASINKGHLSLASFEHFNPEKHYDSFILGSSIACYYDIDSWLKYLPEGARATHIDCAMMTYPAMERFMVYLDNHAESLSNLLIVLTPEMAEFTPQYTSPPFILPPQTVPEDPFYPARYHYVFFKSFANYRFLKPYIHYRRTGEITNSSMVFEPQPIVYRADVNQESIPLWEQQLHQNPNDFHSPFISAMFPRLDAPYTIVPASLNHADREALQLVADILHRRGTSYKVIMSPSRRLLTLSHADSTFMATTFGKNYIDLTRCFRAEQSDPTNFYDVTHYRPTMAQRYMQEAYSR